MILCTLGKCNLSTHFGEAKPSSGPVTPTSCNEHKVAVKSISPNPQRFKRRPTESYRESDRNFGTT